MRLIDADALKEEVNKKNVVGRFNTILLIDNAPTVPLPDFKEGYKQAILDIFKEKARRYERRTKWMRLTKKL